MPIPDDVKLKQESTLIAIDLQGTTETGIRTSVDRWTDEIWNSSGRQKCQK